MEEGNGKGNKWRNGTVTRGKRKSRGGVLSHRIQVGTPAATIQPCVPAVSSLLRSVPPTVEGLPETALARAQLATKPGLGHFEQVHFELGQDLV